MCKYLARRSFDHTEVQHSGAYGVGSMANKLTLGCDCLDQILDLVSSLNLPRDQWLTFALAGCIRRPRRLSGQR